MNNCIYFGPTTDFFFLFPDFFILFLQIVQFFSPLVLVVYYQQASLRQHPLRHATRNELKVDDVATQQLARCKREPVFLS